MQHLVVRFEHGIQDVIPWSQFIEYLKPRLAETQKGAFVGDDMAIDGGDCEAVFSGPDAKALLDFLRPRLQTLPFLQKPSTTIELVLGELESSAEKQRFALSN